MDQSIKKILKLTYAKGWRKSWKIPLANDKVVCLGSLKFLFSLSSLGKVGARVAEYYLMENVCATQTWKELDSSGTMHWWKLIKCNEQKWIPWVTSQCPFSMGEQHCKLASTAVLWDCWLMASKSYPKMLSDEYVWLLHQETWILFTFKSRMQQAFLILLCIFYHFSTVRRMCYHLKWTVKPLILKMSSLEMIWTYWLGYVDSLSLF